MQRPKQQALAFLLGALLVGGVVGFSADRMFRQTDNSIAARRKRMYDDLALAQPQRLALYSPLQPAYDSIKAARRMQINAILTPDQRQRLDARRKDDEVKRDAERKHIKSSCRK
jgi:hypothetical protein